MQSWPFPFERLAVSAKEVSCMIDYKDVEPPSMNGWMLLITATIGAICWIAVAYLFAFLVML